MTKHLEIIGVFLALVVTIGGFIYWSGTPPFANEASVAERFASSGSEIRAKFLQIDLGNKEQRVDNLSKRIFDLEAMKIEYTKRGEAWPMDFEGELQRLKRLLGREIKKYDILLDRVEEGQKK